MTKRKAKERSAAPSNKVAKLALERIEALRLKHRALVLGMMQVIRTTDLRGSSFDDLVAIGHEMAELEFVFMRAEQELLIHTAPSPEAPVVH